MAYKAHAHELSWPPDAVDSIRGLSGEEPSMLIIVDELSKASRNYDISVMKQLGVVLSTAGRTDILVSSLSPAYIDNLLLPTCERITQSDCSSEQSIRPCPGT